MITQMQNLVITQIVYSDRDLDRQLTKIIITNHRIIENSVTWSVIINFQRD